MEQLQATVLRAMLTVRGWNEYSDIVCEEILTDNLVRALYTHIQNLHARTDGNLSIDAVRLDIEATYRQGESRAEELVEALSYIEQAPEVREDVLEDAVRKYAQRQWVKKACQYGASHISDSDLDVHILADYIQRAMEVRTKVHVECTSIFDAPLPGEVDDRPNVCSLGLADQLDTMLGGGAGSGELVVFLAPPKRGKTTILCTIGARAAAKGRGVLHITLEISKRRVVRRYETVWTKLKYLEMIGAPNAILAARNKVKQAGGDVHIEDWSHMGHASPYDVQALVNRLRSRGKKIDMVIIDYLELMQPNQTKNMARREMRHVYGQLGKDMRAMANAVDVPVITAWQVNRAGNSIDTPTQEHVSESWDIIKHADTLLSLGQTHEERKLNTMRIVVLEHRFSTDRGIVYLHCDMDRCDIKALEGSNDHGELRGQVPEHTGDSSSS